MQHFLICALLLGCVVAQQCTYNGKTFNDGEGFPSEDGCNRCACNGGSVMCTLMACVKPIQPTTPPTPTVKSGKCPAVKSEGAFGLCSESCSTDSDCLGENKCCSNGCGHSCQAPETEVKTGSCPDGSNPVNCLMAPCAVSKCAVEGATCADNYCGGCKAIWTVANGSRVCDDGAKPRPRPTTPRRPYKKGTGSCPDGSNPVNCFVAPCTTSKCEVEGAVCANNYCGGCRAIWTANGARVCAGNITRPRPVPRPRPTFPSKTGACPGGRPPVKCLMAPCAVSKCDVENATCANSYCGGCKATWTLNGVQVCAEPTVPKTKSGFCPPVPAGVAGICTSSCSSDSDCTGTMKCCSNGCGSACTQATGGVKPVRPVRPTTSCAVVLCASGTQCVESATGPRCVATAISQALADQQSTYGSSSSSDNSSVAGWVVVGVAAIVAVALFAVAIMITKRLQ